MHVQVNFPFNLPIFGFDDMGMLSGMPRKTQYARYVVLLHACPSWRCLLLALMLRSLSDDTAHMHTCPLQALVQVPLQTYIAPREPCQTTPPAPEQRSRAQALRCMCVDMQPSIALPESPTTIVRHDDASQRFKGCATCDSASGCPRGCTQGTGGKEGWHGGNAC